MATKAEYKPKCVKIYDLDEFEKLLAGVKVASCMLTESPQQPVDEESVIKRLNTLTLGGPSKLEQCSCCGAGPFESRAHQTAHYKHHWHTYNLKRKLFGRTPLTLQQFNARQDDNSSVSGSESESEEPASSPSGELFAAATRHCKAFFTNTAGQVFCIYRCLLHHRKEDLSTDGAGRAWAARCRELARGGAQRVALLKVSGGHFAGAIYSGSVPVLHKTHHSYVSRRGQGQAQAARDQHGSAPRSAGASLRRYNQAQFIQHVQAALAGWAPQLAGCARLLYRAVGASNQAALFGKGSPLTREDVRVRALPFPTRKPTFKEVQRAFDTLAAIDVYESMESFQNALTPASPAERRRPAPPRPDRAKSREPPPRAQPPAASSGEDEGPGFIDDAPPGWIQALIQQAATGAITNSRKDLLNDNSVGCPSSSDSEVGERKKKQGKKKKKKKQEEKKPEEKKPEEKKTEEKKPQEKKEGKKTVKIPQNIKNLWQAINDSERQTLDTILERWEECGAGVGGGAGGGAGAGGVAAVCNVADPADGNTALHKASIAAKPEMVTELLAAGADPSRRNHKQQTPYAAAAQAATRHAFRLFQAEHPDMHDYSKSHIPGPATPASLAAEEARRAAARRGRRARGRARRGERAQAERFRQLSDHEKVSSGDARCFSCGGSLAGPAFSYQQYSFCSVVCLQRHRQLRPLQLTA